MSRTTEHKPNIFDPRRRFARSVGSALACVALLGGCRGPEDLSALESSEKAYPAAVMRVQDNIGLLAVTPDNQDMAFYSTVQNVRFADGDTVLVGAGHGLIPATKRWKYDCNKADASIQEPVPISIDDAGTRYKTGDKGGKGNDIAVLWPHPGSKHHLPTIPAAPSSPVSGDIVYSAGYSVNQGDSALHITSGEYLGVFGGDIIIAQTTDKSIVGGNSGGPVLNEYGQTFAVAYGVSPEPLSIGEINTMFALDLEPTASSDDEYVIEYAVPLRQETLQSLGQLATCDF